MEVTEINVNEAKTEDSKPILYKVKINSIPVIALFDTGTGMSIMSSRFSGQLSTNSKFLSVTGK